MPIVVQCPNPLCKQSCSVADSVSGGPVRCAKCGKPFAVKPTFDGQNRDTKKSQPSSNANPFPILPAEFGRYRVLRLLGKGGMGAVYLAQDSQLGRQVALKIPFFDAAESPERAERFVREARSAAALHHPNICTVFDAGQIDGRPFLTMAYIAGTPLENEIDPEAPMSQVRAAEIARKIALALEHAHRKGIVHRDLKPANVMLAADDGEPVVMDFGLAKRFGDVGPGESKLTRIGGIVGTPSYMSPEQVKGDGQALGPATDVYSLGVVLFEMLTGNTPYSGAFRAVLGQILAAPVPPVKEFRADVDSRLDAICRKAMAKEPTARFASMAAFANALGQYLKAPFSSPPPLPAPLAILVPQAPSPVVDRSPFDHLVEATVPAPTAKKAKSRRAVVIALALALLVPLGAWLAVIMLRVETANGTLIVEMNDDEVEARIKSGKLILSGPDGKVRYTLTAKDRSKKLEAGPYKIHVEGADGLVLDTPEFTLRKGDKVTVRVTMGPKAAVKKAEPKQGQPLARGGERDAIFNGTDLAGWEGLPGYWRVEGGAIVGSMPNDPGFNTFLCSKKRYSDFELKCQVRLKGGIGNSGVQIRSKVVDDQKFIVAGPQCDMGTDYWGSLYGERSGGMMKQSPPALVKKVVKNDDFNDYYIKCVGKHVTIKINGDTMVDGDFPLMPEEGIIAWQLHTGFKSMEVAFKDIQFTNLSKPRADGFVPLFNGKDLAGWKVNEEGRIAFWGVENGLLHVHGNGGWLMTEKEYSDFELRLEFKLPEKGEGGVALRSAMKGRPAWEAGMEIQLLDDDWYTKNFKGLKPEGLTGSIWGIVPPSRKALKPIGEWNAMRIVAKGRNVTVVLNGTEIVNANLDAYKAKAGTHPGMQRKTGHIGLQSSDAPVEFRKIEVKSLKE